MPPTTPPPPAVEHARWFADEVQPHALSLRSYLENAFPAVRSEVDDVVQDSLLRVWLARAKQPIRSARGFLFKVARHRAIDALRRARAVPLDLTEDFERTPNAVVFQDAVALVSREEKSHLLAEAIDALPARCRQVVVLRKLRLIPQREVAHRLGISEKTVEAQLARGLKRLEAKLRLMGIHYYYDADE